MTNIAIDYLTVCHGKSPFLRTVNHLFLWAIYTVAMLVITRGYYLKVVLWPHRKKIRHMKKIDLFLEFLHSWIDGHWWVDIGFEKHIKQLKKNIGCPIMFIPLFSQDKTLVVLY